MRQHVTETEHAIPTVRTTDPVDDTHLAMPEVLAPMKTKGRHSRLSLLPAGNDA
jgi:hypothetical protein